MGRRQRGLPLLRRVAAIAAAGVVLLLGLAPAHAQTDADQDSGYDFFSVSGLADGITTRVVIEHFLAVEEFVALSSVSAEARLELSRSTALAVLPDPGDLVLGLPGTLAALAGIGGLPDYPAVSRADYPVTPNNEVSLAPDAGLGALRLSTEAQQNQAHGRAFVTDLADTVGLVPMTVGSIKSDSVARRIDPLTYESTATTTVNDIGVLHGLLRIAELTSTVTARVDDGKITATRDETNIAGARLAGMPVEIDDRGITAPNGSQALAPLIDALAAPLQAAGVTVKTTPGQTHISATKGTADSGYLDIGFTSTFLGSYPAVTTLSLGKASATVEASGRSDDVGNDVVGALVSGVDQALGPPPAGNDAGALSGATDVGSGGGNGNAGVAAPRTGGDETASGPLASLVTPMDFRSLYRWLALALAGALVARWLVVSRLRPRSATRPNLRDLWRW